MKYFKIEDFKCKCGECVSKAPPVKLQELVDKIREKVGCPLLVTSGYRCPKYNSSKKVGGAKSSRHVIGDAADLTVWAPKLTKAERKALTKRLQEAADELNVDGGVGVYPWGVHVDVRGWWARW